MDTTDVHAVHRHWSRWFGNVVRVDEHQCRFDGRRDVVEPLFRGGRGRRVPVVQVDGVQIHGHVIDPLVESVGHAARGQQMRHDRRVSVVAERGRLDPGQQRRGHDVNERNAETASRV